MTDDIEAYRRQFIADRDDGATESELKKQYAPGTYGCHEALHMALFLESAVSRELLEHGAVLANPAWFALAERASSALADLYQAIGSDSHHE